VNISDKTSQTKSQIPNVSPSEIDMEMVSGSRQSEVVDGNDKVFTPPVALQMVVSDFDQGKASTQAAPLIVRKLSIPDELVESQRNDKVSFVSDFLEIKPKTHSKRLVELSIYVCDSSENKIRSALNLPNKVSHLILDYIRYALYFAMHYGDSKLEVVPVQIKSNFAELIASVPSTKFSIFKVERKMCSFFNLKASKENGLEVIMKENALAFESNRKHRFNFFDIGGDIRIKFYGNSHTLLGDCLRPSSSKMNKFIVDSIDVNAIRNVSFETIFPEDVLDALSIPLSTCTYTWSIDDSVHLHPGHYLSHRPRSCKHAAEIIPSSTVTTIQAQTSSKFDKMIEHESMI